MNRIIIIVLGCLSLLFPAGCSSAEPIGISFYYCREPDAYQFFQNDGVIRSEPRDITGHRNDLRYMVSLYLAGPMEESLVSPFRKTTKVISTEQSGSTISIELSDHSKDLTDSEFSLACACLTLTCMDFMDCESVTIISGERSMTMNSDNILLYDTLLSQENTGGQK